MTFRKDEQALKRIHGLYDNLRQMYLVVVLTSSFLSCDKYQSSLVHETPWEGIYDNLISFGAFSFRQIRGVQRNPLPAFVVFHMPKITNLTKQHSLG